MPDNTLRQQLAQLNSGSAFETEFAKRMNLAQPELQGLMDQLQGGLNLQGLYSPSAMTSAGAKLQGNFAGQIGKDVFSQQSNQKMALLQMIMQQDQFRRRMKAQNKAGLFGFLGTALGIGASFIPGFNAVNKVVGTATGGGTDAGGFDWNV